MTEPADPPPPDAVNPNQHTTRPQPHERHIQPSSDGETYGVGQPVVRPVPVEDEPPRVKRRHPAVRFLTEHWEHESETSVFLLVSMLDFFCTYLLLMTGPAGGRQFVESNPVAAWFLNHYGIVKGLLGFKLLLVVIVCGLSQAISYQKPRVGRGILLFGTLVTTAVVLYSVRLLLGSYGL